jgi:hypothetical protein
MALALGFTRRTLMKHPSQLRLAMAQINVIGGGEGNVCIANIQSAAKSVGEQNIIGFDGIRDSCACIIEMAADTPYSQKSRGQD